MTIFCKKFRHYYLLLLTFGIFGLQGQNYAPLKMLKKYGIQISQLPGECKSPVTLVFTNSSETRLSLVNLKNVKSKIEGNSLYVELEKNTTLFIKLFVTNKKVDTVFVGSYIFNKKSNLPTVCLYLNRDDFDAPGGIITGKLSISEKDSSMTRIGRVWKKESIPVFMEYFEKGKFKFGANCRVKPFGGMTLSQSEKSLRLIADSSIGPKKFHFNPFFNKTHLKSFKSIVLRTSGNDQLYTRIKDVTLSSVARDLNLDYLDYRPSVLYINGEYWGIYNIREKCNLEYLNQNYNVPKDKSTDLLEQGGERSKEYNQMISFVGKKFPEKSAIDSVNSKMVLSNYIDYIIWQIHIQNIDSRGNIRFWKSKNYDNKWRWIFYDSDLSSAKSQVGFNYLAKRLSSTQTNWYNPTWATVLLRNLISHKRVKHFFINEYCLLLGTKLHADTLQNRVADFAENIRAEIPEHVKRRNRIYGESVKSWESTVNSFRIYFKLRNETAITHLKECFALKGSFSPLKVFCNVDNIKTLRLKYSAHLFNRAEAKFFSDIPIEFEATNLDQKYKFIRWEYTKIDSSAQISVNTEKVNEIRAIYEKKSNSELFQKILCYFVYTKLSKKSNIYVLGITNVSSNNLDHSKIIFKTNGSEKGIELDMGAIKKGETKYFSNDSTAAKDVLKNNKYTYLYFPLDFNPIKNEWVLLDNSDRIIDSLFIITDDSLKKTKKGAFYYRDIKTGNWSLKESFKQEEKKQLREINKTLNSIPFFILFFIISFIFLSLFIKKKKSNKLLIFIISIVICQNYFSQIKFPDRFGLDSIHTKLINNKGNGYDSIYGCRNVRVILKNLIYRGGNNNQLSVQNPLMLRTINDLKKQGFNDIIYLYNRNFDRFFPTERLDSLRDNGINYVCSPALDSSMLINFLLQVHQKANVENPSLTYLHCWNGWHQSGWLSAITLMQFCDYSNEQALKYWTINTDGNYKGYSHVKNGILSFRPYPNLEFTKEQKEKHCPCIDKIHLDTIFALTELNNKSVNEKKRSTNDRKNDNKKSQKKRNSKSLRYSKSVKKNSKSKNASNNSISKKYSKTKKTSKNKNTKRR
jgi:hypothetical protein